MTNYYSHTIAARYIINLLSKIEHYPFQMKAICEYLNEQYPFYDFDAETKTTPQEKTSQFQIKKLLTLIAEWDEKDLSYEFEKIDSLKKSLDLDNDDIEIIQYAYLLNNDVFFADFILQVNNEVRWTTPVTLLSFILDIEPNIIERKCLSNNKITATGIIRLSELRYHRHVTIDGIVTLSDVFSQWIKNRNCLDIMTAMCGYPTTPKLKADDYFYIEKEKQSISKFLQQALLLPDKKGINILIYGEPGTGKTEFVKMISTEINVKLYAIGEESHLEETTEISRDDRLHRLNLANILLKDRSDSLLLFDEMEDLLHSGYGLRKESKIFMNRLLEHNNIPTIWICNALDHFDPAFLRRMQFVFELKKPPVAARIQTWKNIINTENLEVSQEDIISLACEFDEPPALTMNAIKAAKMIGGSKDDIAKNLNNMRRAMGHKTIAPKNNGHDQFDPNLCNADIDLQDLASKLCGQKAQLNFSLCLYGVSGTGKSAYARHLAKCLGLEVSHIRASNLISPFVGQTEQKIAQAFETARESKQLLIFDEADSFLRERSHARNSWEVTAVNEMLTWMESHPYPFVCSTNLMNTIDSAALRRFTFKINFSYLRESQIEKSFFYFFNIRIPQGFAVLDNLTLGDFAVVKRKAQVLGVAKQAKELLKMLHMESECKLQGSKPIGFLARSI